MLMRCKLWDDEFEKYRSVECEVTQAHRVCATSAFPDGAACDTWVGLVRGLRGQLTIVHAWLPAGAISPDLSTLWFSQ